MGSIWRYDVLTIWRHYSSSFVAWWEWLYLTWARAKMAATIKDSEEDTSKRKHIKAVLVNKLEGCSAVVNMAVTVPHEDAVISVSDDK